MRTDYINRFMIAGLLMFVPHWSGAAIFALQASLDSAQANAGAGTGSLGTGIAEMVLDTTTTEFSWFATWSDLSGPATAAHFHGPALPNQNAGIQIPIDHLSNPSLGFATLTTAQVDDLLAGLWYLNIHTALNPGGEIRGQVQVVPVPAAAWLFGSGLLGLIGIARRKKSA